MLSKVINWVFGGKISDAKNLPPPDACSQGTEADENKEGISPPAGSRRFTEDHADNLQDSSWQSKNVQNGSPLERHFPKALQSAFNQPDKDKKPFSYFAQGLAPDLTSNPSPKAVRRANPLLHGPPTPKVLPIVSDSDLRDFFENREKINKIQKPVAISGLTNSTQYNTPIALYSKDTLNGELKMQQNHVVNSDRSFKSMMNHHNSHCESDTEEHPRYTGHHVNPKSQSPCFKRLQYVTGLHADSEDERPVEVKPSDVRTIENGYPKMTTDNHQVYQQIETPVNISLQPPTFYGHAQHRTKQQPIENTIEDPVLLAKIREAERSKVPAPVVPEWIRQAAMKSEKWRGYAEYQDSHKYEGPAVPSTQLATPTPWQSRRSPTTSRASSTIPRSYQQKAHSVEPHRMPEKEHWMKPFVASNVTENFSTPLTVRTSMATPTYKIFSPVDPGNCSATQKQAYESASAANIHYQSNPVPYSMTPSWSAPKIQEHQTVRPPSAPKYTIETTYFTPLTPKPETKYRPASRQSPAPWTSVGGNVGSYNAAAYSSSSNNPQGVYQHEQEAYDKMKELEREVARKASEPKKSGVSPGWKPVPAQRSTVSQAAEEPVAISQQWQDADGASTKSQTTGSYVDNEGNVVHYVKEVYTSSDPGKEFSMLSQQERKVLEEPLEPGVVARHTTTKYYKKSTFTSSSTTAASQTTPAIGAGTMPAPRAVTLPRHTYKTPVMESTY